MKRTRWERMNLLLLTLLMMTNLAGAQSRHRDRPTPLESNELRGDLDGSGDESFYSFVAGPGEIKITVDVRSVESTAVLNFELLDQDANKQILCCEFAQADSAGESGRNIKTVKFGRRQTVVLRLTQAKTGRGTYRVRLTGAALLKGADEER